jgi:hypothetical protein
MASWIAPRRQELGLRDWWILVERGELPAPTLRQCWTAFVDAVRLRLDQRRLRLWLRGPAFPLAAGAVVVALAAIFTRGFSGTRGLIGIAQALRNGLPPPPGRMGYDFRQDMVVGHGFLIAFGLAIGIVLVAVGRLSLHRYGWRYWLFLVLKTIGVMVIVPLLWIEIGTAFRTHLPRGEAWRVLGILTLALAFVAGYGYALMWSFADQRRRCPVCLHWLAMPVTMGSWASVFEPVTTELLCEEGHGSLCMPENEGGEPDRWTALDASWRELFEDKPKAGR